MTPLRASWLGSWAAPWGPRGRRWGDASWALGAISQAWLLGGREGRWPRTTWENGPRPSPWSGEWTGSPDPAWVALLRHGSPQAEATRRGRREGELEAWCWAELLEGRSDAWWARASLLLSLEERIRWLPWLGGRRHGRGFLHLPPFLSQLLPAALHQLPEGWWESLLRDLDATGHLLPAGSLPQGLPWELLTSDEGWLKPLDPGEPPLHPDPLQERAMAPSPLRRHLDDRSQDPGLGEGRGTPSAPGRTGLSEPRQCLT